MGLNRIILGLVTMVFIVLVTACGDGGDTEPVNNENIRDYSGSGSKGDLITFQINHQDLTYTVQNETTNQNESGSYFVMDDQGLEGVYQVNIGGNAFYAVELTDRIIAANFPTGNPQNNISFGVSADLDNNGNESNISGDYTYIIMDNDGIEGDPRTKEWGILSVNEDHSWDKLSFATNNRGNGHIPELSPENYQGQLPVRNTGEFGTWRNDGEHSERILVDINGIDGSLSGYLYATQTEGAFLLDLGVGNGFLLGLKITANNSFSSMAGDYKFVNVWEDGFGAGNYSIDSNGNVSWVHQGSAGNSSGAFQLLQCSNVFGNVFYANNVELDPNYFEKMYVIVLGDIMIHFSFDESNGDFAQYGIGASIN